jgi:hypothetical protein
MRGTRLRNLGVALAFGGFLGCTPPGPNLKTPYREQIVAPPEDDPRFSQPIAYPKEVLNKGPVKPEDPSKLPSQRPQFGPGGPGMGGF